MTLLDELTAPLPPTFYNFMGKEMPAPYPKGGTLIARCGAVFLFQLSKTKFSVVYGLDVRPALLRDSAAVSFGQCCFHQAESEGLLEHLLP